MTSKVTPLGMEKVLNEKEIASSGNIQTIYSRFRERFERNKGSTCNFGKRTGKRKNNCRCSWKRSEYK